MTKVREKIGKQLRNFSFSRLTSSELETIYSLYDYYYFGDQLTDRIFEKNSYLEFLISPRETGHLFLSGKRRMEGVAQEGYYLEFAPRLLPKVHKISSQESKEWGCTSLVDTFQMAMEHEMVHLLLWVWGYVDPSSKKYSCHGRLFQCSLARYMGHHYHDYDTPSAHTPHFGYQNWKNSCYIDSLLILLLHNQSPYWREAMMTLPLGSSPHLQEALQFREIIKEDYTQLQYQPIRCRSLRTVFRDLIPELQRNEWGMFNSYEIYEALTTLFPTLLMGVPEKVGASSRRRRYPLLSFWEYMEGKNQKKEILWEKINSPTLVFYNGGAPRIRNFHRTGEEYSTITIHSSVYQEKIRKNQAFGMTILRGRYRLVGVITLEGVAEGREGGSHYTSYFFNNNEWYHYNDIGPTIKKIDQLPSEGVWVEKGGKMPSMYFYERVES